MANSVAGSGVFQSEMISMHAARRHPSCPSRCPSARLPARAGWASGRPSGSCGRGCGRSRSRTRRRASPRGRAPASARCLPGWRLPGSMRAVAHDEHPHGGVRQLGAEVDVVLAAFQRVRYSPKLPSPSSGLRSGTAPGMSSTPSISSMRLSRSAGLHRREADAAIAHHRGGDAVPGRRRRCGVPDRLAVVVGVDVDEARRDRAGPWRRSPPRRCPTPRRPRRSCRP